ncbi:MAG: guanylate kinase [Gammaproteobacteria bacterium]
MIGQLFIISAPSGAGKTSLVSALVSKAPDISVSISHTTREKRSGENSGVDYHFVNKLKFDQMVEAGDFLEHAQVFDNYYGTSNSTVDSQLASGTDVILEIDWQGARQIRKQKPDCRSIFILPPSYHELEHRLNHREEDSKIIERRMRDAIAEMSHYKDYEFIVVNDDFHTALADLESIFRASRLRSKIQQRNLEQLLDDLLER